MAMTEGKSDEEMRKLLVPAVTPEEALLILNKFYADIGGDEFDAKSTSRSFEIVRQLDSYDDVNYWVRHRASDEQYTDYLLKVHNGVESTNYIQDSASSVIAYQMAIMEGLGGQENSNINTNKPVLSGKSQDDTNEPTAVVIAECNVVSEDHSPSRLCVRLLSWIDGTPMSELSDLSQDALVRAGQSLADLHRSLDSLVSQTIEAPWRKAAQRFHQWDGKQMSALQPFVDMLPQEELKRDRVQSILKAYQQNYDKMNTELASGLNHADFNDANILVDSEQNVVGVIDWGDSVESWRILDLAVAMAYSMLSVYAAEHKRSFSAAAAVLYGYTLQREKGLTQFERQSLLLLMTCRLATSTTLGHYSFLQNPQNEYLLLHAKPGWNALALLWPMDDSARVKWHAFLQEQVVDRVCNEGSLDHIGPDETLISQCT